MILGQHLCKSCRQSVKQLKAGYAGRDIYWCTRPGNIAMVKAAKWMPVDNKFGCRFWCERMKGEQARRVDVKFKRIGGIDNSRAIGNSVNAVGTILHAKTGKLQTGQGVEAKIKNLIATDPKRKWKIREIEDHFLKGAKISLDYATISRLRLTDRNITVIKKHVYPWKNQ